MGTYLLETADKWGLPKEYLIAVKFTEDTPKESYAMFIDDDSSNGNVNNSSQYFLAKSSRKEKKLLGFNYWLDKKASCWTYSVKGANGDKKYYIVELPLKESAVKLAGKPADELDVSIFKSAEQIRQDFGADELRNGLLEVANCKTLAKSARRKHRHKRHKKHRKKHGHKKHGHRHQKHCRRRSDSHTDRADLV